MKIKYGIVLCTIILAGCKNTHTVQKTAQADKVTAGVVSTSSKPVQEVHLPVFIPTAQLQKQLYDNFFAPTYGKYYPCQDRTDCSDLYKDVYIENPVLKVTGDVMTIQLHLAGQTKLLIFHPDVSGDILLSAKPIIRNDTLFFDKMTMQRSSQTLLLRVASKIFEKQIIKKMQENAWYAFRPTLDKYTTDFQKQMPFKWDTSVLLLSLKKISLNGVSIQQPPNEGIIADFSAEFCTEDSSYGQK
jgi:Domain of unknown function (DUF4403)